MSYTTSILQRAARRGRIDEAEELWKRAISAYELVGGEHCLDVNRCPRDMLVQAHVPQGRFRGLVRRRSSVQYGASYQLPPVTPTTSEQLVLSDVRRINHIVVAAYGPDHVAVANANGDLVEILVGIEREEWAQEYLREARRIRELLSAPK